MNSSLFNDRRAAGLLHRVREDVSQLRDDIGSLVSHTTRRTLPNSAKDLTAQAKQGLAAGGAYAVSRIRDMRSHQHRPQAGWVGGALVLGLLAYGAYALFRTDAVQEDTVDDTSDFSPQDEMI